MKTIPVSFLVAGMLMPAVCLAQPPEPPKGPPAEGKGERRGPPQAFAEAWKLADTDHDGFITKAEFDAMPRLQNLPEEKRENLFKRLDKDGDGKLSREELERVSKPHDGPGQPMKRLWELDADKNGGISFDEFKAGQIFMKLPADKQEEVFHRLDTDGDRVITPKDRPQHPFKRPDGKPRPNHPEGGGPDENPDGKPHMHPDGMPDDGDGPGHINRKLDVNCDGALSFEEFRVGPAVKNLTEVEQKDRFELLDRNKDLKISPEDFQSPPPADGTPPVPAK